MATQALQVRAGASIVLLASFVGFISLGLPDGTLGVAWPSIRALFERTQADFGLILLAHGAAYFLSSLLAARLARRLSTPTLLVAGSLIVAAGMLAVAIAPSWWLLLSATVLIGSGSGTINTVINTYAAQNFSPRHVNWLHACYSLGAALGPLAMTAIMAGASGWQLGYVIVAGVPLALSTIYMLTSKHWLASGAVLPAAPSHEHARVSSLLVRQVVLFFCYSGLELTLGRWCYTVLSEFRGMPVDAAGLATSGYFGSIFAGRLLLGAAVERVGATRMVRIAAVVAVIGAVSFAMGQGTVAAVGLVLTGFALGPIFPTLVAQTGQRFPGAQLAQVIAVSVAAAILGSAVVPYVAGLATKVFGLTAVLGTAAILAVMLVVMHESLARRTPRRDA